ncbi:MAG TPA: AraC family transcriptional regulator [Candidatus Dormibacteraeota bacterium]|nr:AraC family transcriptional regulator [Candidatus Dormibacteraeota bacterium]
MPEPAHPGKVLHGGEFYSPVQARLNTGDVLLSELRQPSPRVVPRHEHVLAYVTVVLGGHYREGDRGHLDEMPPLTAVFNPVGVAHSTVIGPAGAFLFTVEFRSEAMRALDLRLPGETTFDGGVGTMLWPGLRLFSAFKTDAAPFELEGHIFELLAAIARVASEGQRHETQAPRWFRRVKERLHAEFREHLRMGDLARDAGVHPVHLARVFRKFEKRTPGEYQQRLQARAACELLRDPEWPLAAIAAECGFSDQSHFTRVFRRMAATTPAQFRRAVGTKALAA